MEKARFPHKPLKLPDILGSLREGRKRLGAIDISPRKVESVTAKREDAINFEAYKAAKIHQAEMERKKWEFWMTRGRV